MLPNPQGGYNVQIIMSQLMPIHQESINWAKRLKTMLLFLNICDDCELVAELMDFLTIPEIIKFSSLNKYTHKILNYQHL